MNYDLKQLGPNDLELMNGLLARFAEDFEEPETYNDQRPDATYTQELLASNTFIALVAHQQRNVIAGLAAYELKKFEQRRSEIYIYDLAVAPQFRRRGIATALIEELQTIAAARGAWVIFVQADIPDEPAVKLYSKLGTREKVLHFDIPVIRNAAAKQGH